MKVYCVVVSCLLFTTVATFSLPDAIPKNSNDSLVQEGYNRRCRCENGRCVTDNKGNTKCVCKNGYALQDDETCKPCDCGSLGKCIFIKQLPSGPARGNPWRPIYGYQKKCVCDVGSAEKDGVCIDCYCGENSACDFDYGMKRCYCIEGYSEKNGVCTKCDCGFNGECRFDGENKICTCDEGYLEVDGKCEECDCGENGGCSYINGQRTCSCHQGYSENNGVCEACDCGSYATKCFFTNGTKQCDCMQKFAVRNGVCDKCDCGDNSWGCNFINDNNINCQCNEGYVQKGYTCEAGCTAYRPCQNGGYCKEGFCYCLHGTRGEFCEVVDECDSLCPRQSDIQCAYDVAQQEAYCQCQSPHLKYNPEVKQCRNQCGNDGDCQNGGSCSSTGRHSFCKCPEGTTGDFCENVPECESMRCGSDAKCVYDQSEKRAVCKCDNPNLSFDIGTIQCKNSCDEDRRRCQNGGVCSRRGSDSFCDCLEGTGGDFCEKVPECDSKNCGSDARCLFDTSQKRAICVCSDANLSFDPVTLQCKRSCDVNERCQNGGSCEETELAKFCRCPDGTVGDFCDEVPECNYKDCGVEAECRYNTTERRAECMCKDGILSFDAKDKKCKETCKDDSSCQNSGKCEGTAHLTFCDCLDGTAGPHCERVLECELVECGPEADCVFHVETKRANCECKDPTKQFDTSIGRCRRICDDQSPCNNGGQCVDHFCDCLHGTTGDLCETVPECNTKDCGQDAKCVYSPERQSAICLCVDERYSFDEENAVCKKGCNVDDECANGGKCVFKGRDSKFCDCLGGTRGDLCEVVEGCVENRVKCNDDAVCVFDSFRQKAICKCPDEGKRYDFSSGKCKRTCYEDASCQNGGLCVHKGDHLFCRCKNGTSGDLCETVDDCVSGLCGFTTGVNCLYDVTTESGICQCKDAEQLYDPSTKTCRACDCGQNSNSCRYVDGNKVCDCLDGYGDRDGICRKTRCIEKCCMNGKCEVVDDEEVCTCYEGYELEGDYCNRLNCSNTPCTNGKCIVRRGNKEECVCPSGFSLRNGECIRGACSMHTCFGGACRTIHGELMCVCPKGYSLQGIGCFATVCKHQECYGGKCDVVEETGEEVCTCHKGYYLDKNVCKMVLCHQPCFGGVCEIIDGKEECVCPAGHSLFEGVCRANTYPR